MIPLIQENVLWMNNIELKKYTEDLINERDMWKARAEYLSELLPDWKKVDEDITKEIK